MNMGLQLWQHYSVAKMRKMRTLVAGCSVFQLMESISTKPPGVVKNRAVLTCTSWFCRSPGLLFKKNAPDFVEVKVLMFPRAYKAARTHNPKRVIFRKNRNLNIISNIFKSPQFGPWGYLGSHCDIAGIMP